MAHRIAIASLRSISPYTQSRSTTEDFPMDKENKEKHEDYDERIWREKAHYAKNGHVYIPPAAFTFALTSAAQQLSDRIPNKGQQTYTKFFRSGVIVTEGPELEATRETVKKLKIHANADGKRGGGKRVWRSFPQIISWQADVQFHIFADEIPEDTFLRTLRQTGLFVGIGQYRPENGGTNGRFVVDGVRWEK